MSLVARPFDVLGHPHHRDTQPYSSDKVNNTHSTTNQQQEEHSASPQQALGKRRRTSSDCSTSSIKEPSLARLCALQSHARASTDRMQSSNDKTEGPSASHEPSMTPASLRPSSSSSSGALASSPHTLPHPSAHRAQNDGLTLAQSDDVAERQAALMIAVTAASARMDAPAYAAQTQSMLASSNAWGPRSSATASMAMGGVSTGADRLPGIALLDQFLGSPWQGAMTPVDEASGGKPPALPALSIGPSVSSAGSQPSREASQAPPILDGPSRVHAHDPYAASSSGFYPSPHDPRRPSMPSGGGGASGEPRISPIMRGNMSPLWDLREASSFDNANNSSGSGGNAGNLFSQANRQFAAGKQPSYDASSSLPFWPGSRSVVASNNSNNQPQQSHQRQDYQQQQDAQLDSIQAQHLLDQRPLMSSGMPAYPRASVSSTSGSPYDATASSLKRKAPFSDGYYPGVPLPSLMQPPRSVAPSHFAENEGRRSTGDFPSMDAMRAGGAGGEKAQEEWDRRGGMPGLNMGQSPQEVQVKSEGLPMGMGDFSAFRPQGNSTMGYPGQQPPPPQSSGEQQRYGASPSSNLSPQDRFVNTSPYMAPSGAASSVATGSTSTYIPPATQHSPASGATRTGTATFRRRGKLPKQVTDLLKAWLLDHALHPYPTDEEKQRLCAATGLTTNQVSNWFINARRRILVPTSNGGFAVGGSAADPATQQQQQQPSQQQQQQAQHQQQQSPSDLPPVGLEYSRENGWR